MLTLKQIKRVVRTTNSTEHISYEAVIPLKYKQRMSVRVDVPLGINLERIVMQTEIISSEKKE